MTSTGPVCHYILTYITYCLTSEKNIIIRGEWMLKYSVQHPETFKLMKKAANGNVKAIYISTPCGSAAPGKAG